MRIVVSGTVGVGKSTVSKLLVEKFKKETKSDVNFLNEETVDSIYLQYYYESPQEWAFIAQLDFLLGRFKQWLTDEKKRKEDKKKDFVTIYDRHFLDDYIFAELHTIKKNISVFNSITYQAIYKELTDKMNKMEARPDLFFLLEGNFNTIMDRLKGRGRNEEADVNVEYWTDLYNNYYIRPVFQNHFEQNTKKVIKIDTNNKTPEQITEEMWKYIKK